MLALYLTCLIVGGAFVALSALAGGHDHDADHDVAVDHDMDVDAGGDVEIGGDVDLDADLDADLDGDFHLDHDMMGGHGIHLADADADVTPQRAGGADDASAAQQALWLPFYSFKFWTFATCFFGMAGSALTWLQPGLSTALVLPLALGVGGGAGTTVAWAIRKLRYDSTDSMVRPSDLIGVQGTVELPLEPGVRGRVRLRIKGMLVERIATTVHKGTLQVGEPIAVVGVTGATVKVLPVAALVSGSFMSDAPAAEPSADPDVTAEGGEEHA